MPSVDFKRARNFEDIIYEKALGIAKITINRPEVRNTFRPLTVEEMKQAFADARDDADIGVVSLCADKEAWLFLGGDQRIRKEAAMPMIGRRPPRCCSICSGKYVTLPSLSSPWSPAMRWRRACLFAHDCDLTIAADNAIFQQTGPKDRIV